VILRGRLDGCPEKPEVTKLPDTAHDGTAVTRTTYGPGKDGAEVVLYEIEGGGHTWPGRQPAGRTGFAATGPVEMLLGKSTMNISANDLIWEFFQKHPLK
jgi:polyhydroxybutyrate depolymerase